MLWLVAAIGGSSYDTQAGVVCGQPVPFRHKHHGGGLGIECWSSHAAVEESSIAGMPTTKTCMTCLVRLLTECEPLVNFETRPVFELQKTRITDGIALGAVGVNLGAVQADVTHLHEGRSLQSNLAVYDRSAVTKLQVGQAA